MIIGATSAIAHATARIWASDGDALYLVARDPDKLEAIARDLETRGAGRLETRVMDMLEHYRQVGIKYMEVHYEDLITDQGSTTRKILEYIGMPWDDACLQYHKSERVVKTASYEQVTQKIYTSSLYRYRNYHEAVQPLIPIRNRPPTKPYSPLQVLQSACATKVPPGSKRRV